MRGEIFVPFYPCMWNSGEICEDCKLLATNIASLRKFTRRADVKYVFGKEVADFPSVQQLCDLIFSVNKDRPTYIRSESLESYIRIRGNLKALGQSLADERREFIIKASYDRRFPRCPIHLKEQG